jgi:hypothetical protein
MGGQGLIRFLTCLFRSIWPGLASSGVGKWATADAVVPGRSGASRGILRYTVEIVHSDRVGGELYTGLQEAPVFMGSDSESMERFSKGRKFVVRVRLGQAELSVVRDDDQGDGIRKRLEQIDEQHPLRVEKRAP